MRPSSFRFLPMRAALALIGAAGLAAILPSPARAQWSTTYEQFYLQAKHNWEFRDKYQAADRLFNAFDYGHAILYETLWTEPDAPASRLEEREYNFLTRNVLLRPPRVPLEEGAIEIAYAKLAPEAKAMFDWAHILHRQIYDVWADESIPVGRKDAEVARLIAYYKTRRDLAFSSRPKSMELMQEQPYSLAFRQKFPKFNGLIWAYHWLQVGLYEPLLTGRSVDERQLGVRAAVARFWQMLQDAPRTMPYQMPMTPEVAPTFARRYPEAAIIFDNLHSMHDAVSDILANPSVPRARKRAEIMLAARRYRDDTSFVMSEDAWRTMAQHMGAENMGGASVGFLPTLPTPTVTYGAVMTHDERTGAMTGFSYGQATGAHGMAGRTGMEHANMPGMGGANAGRDSARAPAGAMGGMDHGRMNMSGIARTDTAKAMDHAAMGHEAAGKADGADTAGYSMTRMHARMMDMHTRMMADPVIRRRMLADSAMRRMMAEMMSSMPASHRAEMDRMMSDSGRAMRSPAGARGARGAGVRRPAAAPRRTSPPKPKSPTKDSMPGMDHSKHGMGKP